MTAFPSTQQKRIYNYRHSRARSVVENSFGIISAVFTKKTNAEKVVLASCYLHNFLRKGQSSPSYCPTGTFESEDMLRGEVIPGTWRVAGQPTSTLLRLKKVPRKPSELGKEIREEFSLFFSSETGKVPWQENY